VPSAVVTREVEELNGGEQQALFVDRASARSHARTTKYVVGEARKLERYTLTVARSRRVGHVYSLDLESDHPPAVQMEHRGLGGLGVWKRAKQVQVAGFGEAAGHLGLAQEAYVGAPFWATLDCHLFKAFGRNSEALHDALGRHHHGNHLLSDRGRMPNSIE